ncbi:MucBP domain-containing protein [Schaalia sp. ZJ1691]|uniref:MucBP domain-containing protein n=1 Tax=Schaalia sp. ZJ1691 TaxID=2709404 RepID=UPI0013E9FE2F|nr:MucBP domain-containing protein [Schaalia sp. ZJ1691]
MSRHSTRSRTLPVFVAALTALALALPVTGAMAETAEDSLRAPTEHSASAQPTDLPGEPAAAPTGADGVDPSPTDINEASPAANSSDVPQAGDLAPLAEDESRSARMTTSAEDDPEDAETVPTTPTELWVSSTGDDGNNGSSAETAFATMQKALDVVTTNTNITTIHLSGTFSNWPKATIPSGVTLKIEGDTTLSGTQIGIALADGATLTTGAHTLTMTGFATGIEMTTGATLTDGKYVISGGNRAFTLGGGTIEGSADRSSVVIDATGSTGADIQKGSITNATVTATATKGTEHYGLASLTNASVTTTQTWFYFNPGVPFSLDHSDLYVNKATTSTAYRQAMTFQNNPVIANGSTLTADGGRISVAQGSTSFTVTGGSKILIKNSIGKDWAGRDGGGLNINGDGVNVHFVDSILETTNIDAAPSYGVRGSSTITFSGDSQVITDHKNKTFDNGGVESGGSYVVTGGSFYVAYDPNFNPSVTTPTNGEANGNESLSYFTLADSTMNSFNPLNSRGERYEYRVAHASPDGKKHVFAPKATVTFKLNNLNAKFADGTTQNKVHSTVRGYTLGFVEGTTEVAAPTDSTGIAFLGWFSKDATGTEHAFDFATATVNSDTEVYAKWDAKTVIYHNGNGTDYVQSVAASESSTTALSYGDVVKALPAFAVPGKTFEKWTTTQDAASSPVTPGSVLTFPDGEQQIDVYAQFSDVLSTVAFSANGGTFGADSVFRKNPEIFTIMQDPTLGGDIAVVKKQAKYKMKLSELLGSFARRQITPTSAAATKTGFTLANPNQWNTENTGGGQNLRFDDTSLLIFPIPGADPVITGDTIYYLKWKEDANTPLLEYGTEIPSDLWGSSDLGQKDSTSVLKMEATEGATFSLTGAVDVSTIKKQMVAIESQFPNAQLSDIKLTGTTSTFTATLTLPQGVVVPTNLTPDQVETTGLGDLFTVTSVAVTGQRVAVTFGLKQAYSTYEALKAAVYATGTQSAMRMSGANPIADAITLTVPGFSLDNQAVNNGDELTVTGTVAGVFSAVANSTDSNARRFSITWNGTQAAGGKDVRAADDTTIQQTLLVKKPHEVELPADMLVAVHPSTPSPDEARRAGTDSTAHAPAGVQAGSIVNLTGTIDASVIKRQMVAIEGQFGNPTDLASIALSDLSSSFTATFTVPKGMTLPAGLTTDTVVPEGFADTFTVSKVTPSADGRSVSITFTVKNGITNYQQLKDAVFAVSDTMKVTVPGISIDEDVADGTALTTVGTVTGTFDAIATSAAGTEKDFAFTWTGVQTEAGADSLPHERGKIQLSLATPLPIDQELPADMLSGKDTEHTATYPVFAGHTVDLTGAVDIRPIKKQMTLIEQQFGNPDASSIGIGVKSFGFTATFTVPEGMTLPENLQPSDMVPADFGPGFTVTKVTTAGRTVTVEFGLTDQAGITDYKKLKDVVNGAGTTDGWMSLTVPGILVDSTVPADTRLTTVGSVKGTFKAIATSQTGTVKAFSFRWVGTQWDEGKDFATPADDQRITFTVETPQRKDLTIPGDLLTDGDTTHEATPEVVMGSTIPLTGAISVAEIKNLMRMLENHFGVNGAAQLESIGIDIMNFGFTATLTLPEGMSYPEGFGMANVSTDHTFGDAFTVEKVEVKGQVATVKFGLKDAGSIRNYKQLKDAVDAAGQSDDWMRLTFSGIEIANTLSHGQQLTAVGTVTGNFGAIATSASGKRETFNFAWTAEQWADGKDLPATDDTTIQLTVKAIRGAGADVTVTYVDEDGVAIATDDILKGDKGTTYTAVEKAIDGYTFKGLAEGSAPMTGTFGDTPLTVTLVYTKDAPTPDNPDTPDQPDTPDNPDTPGQPDEPGNPSEPGTPDHPEKPTKPGKTPQTPGKTPSTPGKTVNKSAKTLASTGSQAKILMVSAGVVLILGAGALYLRHRNK